MLEQALIDGVKFARERRRLKGHLPLSRLPRVAEELPDPEGDVSYELEGFVDDNGKPGIDVRTHARLRLVCQRCLDRLDFDLQRQTRFLLSATDAELPAMHDEEAEIETVPSEVVNNVADLIEQEVLLGLPIAPSHAEGACKPPEQDGVVTPDSPFAVLRQLKDSKHID